MADGVTSETAKPVVSSSDSRPSKLWHAIKARFGGRSYKPLEPQSLQPLEEPEPEIKKPGIAQFIEEEINKRGLKPPDFESLGASGFSGTNEKIDPEVLHKTRNSGRSPNGYIIGVGVPSLFSFIDAFPTENLPKGIVLVNSDPKSIEQAKQFVEHLARGEIVDFTLSSPRKIYDEEDREYYAGVYKEFFTQPQEEYEDRVYKQGTETIATNSVILRHRDLLIRLAREGNITVVQQDLLNPDLLEILSQLPDLKASNNLIYLSNISDWMWRPKAIKAYEEKMVAYAKGEIDDMYSEIDIEELFKPFSNLNVLTPESPHRNYFADTLGSKTALNYQLRVSANIPAFKRTDFSGIES